MYILSYDNFLVEASQDTIKNLVLKKQFYKDKIMAFKKLNMSSSEAIAKFKEKESTTKNQLAKKIYQERIAEEGMKQQNYATRLQSIQQRIAIIDKQIAIAKLRIQSQQQKKIK